MWWSTNKFVAHKPRIYDMEMEDVLRWIFISILNNVPNRLLVVGSTDGMWSQQVGMCIAKNRRLNDLI